MVSGGISERCFAFLKFYLQMHYILVGMLLNTIFLGHGLFLDKVFFKRLQNHCQLEASKAFLSSRCLQHGYAEKTICLPLNLKFLGKHGLLIWLGLKTKIVP